MEFLTAINEEAQKYGLCLEDQAAELLRLHYDLMMHWNPRCHLTTIVEPEEAARRHYLESLMAADLAYSSETFAWLDIGTGAGFPGIPVKVFLPAIELHLVESNLRKSVFLKESVKLLGLSDVSVHNNRVLELADNPDFKEMFSVISLKAVGNTLNIMNSAKDMLIKDGSFIVFAGEQLLSEIERSQEFETAECRQIPWAESTWIIRVLQESSLQSESMALK